MALRALVVWLGLLVVAVMNGAFREYVLVPRFGAQPGHVISTLMLCAGIVIVTYLTVPWIRPASARSATAIGLAWLILTLAFEFGFGRLRDRSWAELLVDYNVLHGRIWVLVLVATLLAPLLMARARGLQ